MADDWLFETAQVKLASWMAPFGGMFTAPTWQRVLVLVLLIGAVLSPGRRTVAAALRVTGLDQDPHFTNYHRVLNRSRWSSRRVARCLFRLLVGALADPDGVLVIDEIGFLKQGKSSCGVGRQYTGSAGKITNCQIGVFAAYVSRHGHAFIDRALYLPKAWTGDPERMAAAYVPAEISFATKPQLAARMIERAVTAEVPFNWVAADTVYGVDDIEMALRRAGKGYVLGTHANQSYNSWINKPRIAGTAEQIAQDLEPAAWPPAIRLGRSRVGRSRWRELRHQRRLDARPADPTQYR